MIGLSDCLGIFADPVELQKGLKEYYNSVRFRCLIIGRANAGKTTILQRVCNTVVNPEVFLSSPGQFDPENLEKASSSAVFFLIVDFLNPICQLDSSVVDPSVNVCMYPLTTAITLT